MKPHPRTPLPALPFLALCVLLGWATAGLAQAGSSPLDQAMARFESGQWQPAMVELEALLSGGALSRAERSQARKFLAMGNLLLGNDDRIAGDLFKDPVADGPHF